VELGAVEHALCNHPGLAEAVVVQDGRGAPVATVQGQLAAAELRAFLGECLPRNAAARRIAERCGTPRRL
jgi:acyl-coenzyme A synthetase/AMP-(fatty) acid ligase